MNEGTDLVCIFTGSIVEVRYYKERLHETGIASMVKDDFTAGLHAGFPGASGGDPDAIKLLVEKDDAARALQCIEELQANKKTKEQ